MRARLLSLFLLASGSALALGACDGGGDGEGGMREPGPVALAEPWEKGVAIPADEQAPGDAEAGLLALSTEPYVSCGIPLSIFAFAGALAPNGDETPLPGREGKAAGLPYAFNFVTNEDGAELATQNCFTCHAEKFNGKLVLGLGNVTANFTRDMSAVGSVPVPEGFLDDAEEAAFLKLQERAVALAPYVVMPTIGSNPADLIAIVLAAHRDKDTLAWLEEPQVDLSEVGPIPADVPPWWRMSKKNAMFASGLGRGDHRRHMLASSALCTDNVDEADAIDAYAADINAFISSLEAPEYPFAIDEGLAAVGEDLFVENCAGCHGSYGEAERYPNLALPLAEIGTDAAMATKFGGAQDHLIEWFNGSWYGEVGSLEPFEGYVAPPLDGIWATAPFFHNGSVPTIEAVLNSEARPTYWVRHDYDSTNFDESAVGWPFESLDYGHADAPASERPTIYDTTLLGHGNGGHTYGDHLTRSQRIALLEYLKTL